MMSTRLRAMPFPKHLLERTYLENKVGFTDLPYWGDDYVGAGPFKLKELVRGSHLVLDANEGYVLGRPAINQIEVRFVPDANALMTGVLAGAAELTLGARFSLEQAVQVQERWADGTVIDSFRQGGSRSTPSSSIPARPSSPTSAFARRSSTRSTANRSSIA